MEIKIQYKLEGLEWSDMVDPPVFNSIDEAIEFLEGLREENE